MLSAAVNTQVSIALSNFSLCGLIFRRTPRYFNSSNCIFPFLTIFFPLTITKKKYEVDAFLIEQSHIERHLQNE